MAQGKGPTSKIWRNGSLVDWDDANVHVMAHAIHYGSSVFEGMRCYEGPQHGSVFRLREHMRRLHDSAKIYRLALPYSIDELMDATVETIAANGLNECYLRPLVAHCHLGLGRGTH